MTIINLKTGVEPVPEMLCISPICLTMCNVQHSICIIVYNDILCSDSNSVSNVLSPLPSCTDTSFIFISGGNKGKQIQLPCVITVTDLTFCCFLTSRTCYKQNNFLRNSWPLLSGLSLGVLRFYGKETPLLDNPSYFQYFFIGNF